MTQRLRITELDFDTIKTNLKAFLQSQSEFTDYDFEGAGLNVLLDILAYNTHYNAYYLNMVANEAFLDTAILRDSVVSHAKLLGYTPHSLSASIATINITIDTGNTTPDSITLPRGSSFLSSLSDGKAYNFITLEDINVSKANTKFIFENINIYEGNLNSISFTQNNSNNPKQVFILPDTNIDTNTIKVYVTDVSSNTTTILYQKVTDATELSSTSEVYFLEEGRGGQFQIYFGGNNVGVELNDGAIISVSYLVTNGSSPFGVGNFVGQNPIGIYSNYTVTTVSNAAGGDERETLQSIKETAPLSFTSQNRLITTSDYKALVMQGYPPAASISVWGGEDQIPKVFGKVFIAIKPKNGYYLSETEKQRIIDELITPKSVISVKTEIVDPDYIYLNIIVDTKYNKNKTTVSADTLKNSIRTVINTYQVTSLDKFDSVFNTALIIGNILGIDRSIVATDINVRLTKKITPFLNTKKTYVLDFYNQLLRGSVDSQLTSGEFYMLDGGGTQRAVTLGEINLSYTGIDSISVINPGYNYDEIPTVTITGDGYGATAVATIVNGRVQGITVVNRGIGYTKATVSIQGTGNSATAEAIITSDIGSLEVFYFDTNFTKQVVVANAGTINYATGRIEINNLNIQGVNSSDGLLSVNIECFEHYISSSRNQILTIDENDTSSIEITVNSI